MDPGHIAGLNTGGRQRSPAKTKRGSIHDSLASNKLRTPPSKHRGFDKGKYRCGILTKYSNEIWDLLPRFSIVYALHEQNMPRLLG